MLEVKCGTKYATLAEKHNCEVMREKTKTKKKHWKNFASKLMLAKLPYKVCNEMLSYYVCVGRQIRTHAHTDTAIYTCRDVGVCVGEHCLTAK